MTAAELFAKSKQDFIESKQETLLKKISASEKAFYKEVISRFLDRLDTTPDGEIISNSKNIELVTAIDEIFKSFQKSGYIDIVRQFVGDSIAITAKNAEYFRILGEAQNRIPAAEKIANERLRKSLGISENGKIKKSGYLDRLIEDKKPLKAIKKAIYSGIAGNVDLATMQRDLQTVITGNEKVNGSLTKHLNTFLLDTYQQHDRTAGQVFAAEIGLKAFRYAGGRIKSTRCFCEKRNGKVFTIDEAKEWGNSLNGECDPIWNEAKDGNYDPIKMMGGYGCRHSVDWISNSAAIRIRPELKGVL